MRDPDLEEIWQHASGVNAAGVQLLVDKLQSYRDVVRSLFDQVDANAVRSEQTTSVYRLRDHIAAITMQMAEAEFRMDLDHVDLADLTDA